jgi:hypothetical protein
MLLRNPSHRLQASALGLLEPRLRLPSGEGKTMHLRETALMVSHARCEVSLCPPGLVGWLPLKWLRWRALVERLD